MAEPDQNDKNITTHQRKSYHQRGAPSYRGRGRYNAGVNKAIHLFGVRDLREILDRKHEEQEQQGGPPPDPSYNYLKDPSRETSTGHQSQEQHSEGEHTASQSRTRIFRGSRGRGRGRGRGRPTEHQHSISEKPSFIQNPINIKVEIITSTGEKSYTLDETTKLPDFKYDSKYKVPKSENIGLNDHNEKQRYDRGRGRGQRGRRGRGRWERGRGRGRGRGHPNESSTNNSPFIDQEQVPTEVQGEENWDNECNAGAQHTFNIEGENKEYREEEYVEGEQEHEEQYHEHDTEIFVDLDEQIAGPSNINIEENLVITSSEKKDQTKRSVTFKLDDQSQAINQTLKNDSVTDVERPPTKKDEVTNNDE